VINKSWRLWFRGDMQKATGTLAHLPRSADMSDIGKTDIYDGESWSEMDLWDLKNSRAN
jgi:hypothetical protein